MRLEYSLKGWAALVVGAAAVAWSGAAAANTIQLSTLSSEPGIAAEVLDATLDFAVTDGGSPTLVLTARNDTSAPDEFNFNAVFFNASNAVTGLSLSSAVSDVDGDVAAFWDLFVSSGEGGATHADGFGVFDFALLDGVDGQPGVLTPGESVVFTLAISGTGPFSMSDFMELSAPASQESIPAFAAGKFIVGTGDVSAFGAFVPEPATVLLLGSGVVALGLYGRRRSGP